MMESILERENLLRAWQRVKSNAGAPGIDGMTVEGFPAFCRKHWPRVDAGVKVPCTAGEKVPRRFMPHPWCGSFCLRW